MHVYWIMVYAIILHLVWAATLLVSSSPLNITAIYQWSGFLYSQWVVSFMLMLVALLAAAGLVRTNASALWFIPQQIVLMLSALATLHAMLVSVFADGVVRSREFLIADQASSLLIAIIYTIAILEKYGVLLLWIPHRFQR